MQHNVWGVNDVEDGSTSSVLCGVWKELTSAVKEVLAKGGIIEGGFSDEKGWVECLAKIAWRLSVDRQTNDSVVTPSNSPKDDSLIDIASLRPKKIFDLFRSSESPTTPPPHSTFPREPTEESVLPPQILFAEGEFSLKDVFYVKGGFAVEAPRGKGSGVASAGLIAVARHSTKKTHFTAQNDHCVLSLFSGRVEAREGCTPSWVIDGLGETKVAEIHRFLGRLDRHNESTDVTRIEGASLRQISPNRSFLCISKAGEANSLILPRVSGIDTEHLRTALSCLVQVCVRLRDHLLFTASLKLTTSPPVFPVVAERDSMYLTKVIVFTPDDGEEGKTSVHFGGYSSELYYNVPVSVYHVGDAKNRQNVPVSQLFGLLGVVGAKRIFFRHRAMLVIERVEVQGEGVLGEVRSVCSVCGMEAVSAGVDAALGLSGTWLVELFFQEACTAACGHHLSQQVLRFRAAADSLIKVYCPAPPTPSAVQLPQLSNFQEGLQGRSFVERERMELIEGIEECFGTLKKYVAVHRIGEEEEEKGAKDTRKLDIILAKIEETRVLFLGQVSEVWTRFCKNFEGDGHEDTRRPLVFEEGDEVLYLTESFENKLATMCENSKNVAIATCISEMNLARRRLRGNIVAWSRELGDANEFLLNFSVIRFIQHTNTFRSTIFVTNDFDPSGTPQKTKSPPTGSLATLGNKHLTILPRVAEPTSIFAFTIAWIPKRQVKRSGQPAGEAWNSTICFAMLAGSAEEDRFDEDRTQSQSPHVTVKLLPFSATEERSAPKQAFLRKKRKTYATQHTTAPEEVAPKDLSCTVFFARKFLALQWLLEDRGGCPSGVLTSLSRCRRFFSQGGKSGASFFLTLDNKYIAKELSLGQLKQFEGIAKEYFMYIGEVLKGKKVSALAKIVGVFKTTLNGVETVWIVQENVFYPNEPCESGVFDLKGAFQGRTAPVANNVKLDRDLLAAMAGNSFFALTPCGTSVLRQAIANDTKLLSQWDVMDYSLVVMEKDRVLVVGVVDYLQAFTRIKLAESVVKGLLSESACVVAPAKYRDRFRNAIECYFVGVPSKPVAG